MSCGCDERKDFCVGAGATFAPVIRWGLKTFTSVPITAIAQSTPVQITAPAHNCPSGWPAAVVGVVGMYEINARRYPPEKPDLSAVTVLDADDISFNDVSSALYQPYVSGGSLVFNTPADLDGVSAVMSFYDRPEMDDLPLVTLTSGSGITIDTVGKTIIPQLQTLGLLWTTAYYSLEVTDATGFVTRLLEGTLTIET